MSEAVDDEVMEQAFLAEMAGDEPTVEDKEVIQAPEVVAETAETTDVVEPEIQENYSRDEISAQFETIGKLQKSIDTLNGTYGNKIAVMQETIDTLRNELKSRGTNVLPESVMNKLNEDYPELAEVFQVEEQAGEAEKEAEPAEPALTDADKRIEEFIAQQNEEKQQRELRMLADKHSDWQDIAMFTKDNNGLVIWNDPAFGQFVTQLPEEERNTLMNVWDASFVASKISQYKDSLAKKPEKTTESSIEDAVRPSGTRSDSQLSYEEEMEAAFKREMALP